MFKLQLVVIKTWSFYYNYRYGFWIQVIWSDFLFWQIRMLNCFKDKITPLSYSIISLLQFKKWKKFVYLFSPVYGSKLINILIQRDTLPIAYMSTLFLKGTAPRDFYPSFFLEQNHLSSKNQIMTPQSALPFIPENQTQRYPWYRGVHISPWSWLLYRRIRLRSIRDTVELI